jgi:hypothetical protein
MRFARLCPMLLLAAGAFAWGLAARDGLSRNGTAYTNEQLSRGEFLVSIGGCDDCHTPKTFTPKGPAPDMSRRLSGTPAAFRLPSIPAGVLSPNGWGALASGDLTVWAGPWGVSFAANLSPDKATGLGNWTEAAFVKGMKTGKHKGALRDILPPMPWQSLSRLSEEDLRSMFGYLKSLKPIANKVPDPVPPK